MHRIISTAPLLLLALAAPLAAQQATPDDAAPRPPRAATSGSSGASRGTAAAASEPARAVTPEQLIAQGDMILQRGSVMGQAVRKMLEEARKKPTSSRSLVSTTS